MVTVTLVAGVKAGSGEVAGATKSAKTEVAAMVVSGSGAAREEVLAASGREEPGVAQVVRHLLPAGTWPHVDVQTVLQTGPELVRSAPETEWEHHANC